MARYKCCAEVELGSSGECNRPDFINYDNAARIVQFEVGRLCAHGTCLRVVSHFVAGDTNDLIAAAYRRGVRVTLLVEGPSGFPLAE